MNRNNVELSKATSRTKKLFLLLAIAFFVGACGSNDTKKEDQASDETTVIAPENLVEVTAEGATALVCCGEDMELLEAKTADQGKEKHVPVVSEKDGGVFVKVGDVPHPMTDEHWINFIEVCTADTVIRKELNAADAPEGWFNVASADVVSVRSYCNLHGLWKA